MNSYPAVDIIVPCYNVDHIIEQCIHSLIKQEYDNMVHIYLINDGSTDKTLNILNQFTSYSNINIINHKNNQGLSAARNSGIKNSSSDIICFLDSDMIVKKNWVKSHIKHHIKNKKILGVIGDSKLPKGYNENTLDKYFYDERRGARHVGQGNSVNFQYFLFNNSSVKRHVFSKDNLFDETIISYGGEDTDLAIRIIEKFPGKLIFSKDPVSEHHHIRTLKEFCKSMYQYGKMNLPLLLKKHPQYKNDLAGQFICSFKGYLIFNPIIRYIMQLINLVITNYWITRYLIIESVIRGARSSQQPLA